MLLSNIPRVGCLIHNSEIFITDEKYFYNLMKQLEIEGYVWNSGNKPTEYNPHWIKNSHGYIRIYLDGTITHGRLRSDNVLLTIDWSNLPDQSKAQSNICACQSSIIEKRFAGLGANGTWFNFCISCKKEKL